MLRFLVPLKQRFISIHLYYLLVKINIPYIKTIPSVPTSTSASVLPQATFSLNLLLPLCTFCGEDQGETRSWICKTAKIFPGVLWWIILIQEVMCVCLLIVAHQSKTATLPQRLGEKIPVFPDDYISKEWLPVPWWRDSWIVEYLYLKGAGKEFIISSFLK